MTVDQLAQRMYEREAAEWDLDVDEGTLRAQWEMDAELRRFWVKRAQAVMNDLGVTPRKGFW